MIAVLSSSPINTLANAGIQIISIPKGARYPLAMAIALIAWFAAPAPTACTSTAPSSLITPEIAPATELGTDLDETLRMKILAAQERQKMTNA